MKKNEENACKTFIDILQKIKGVEYKQDDFPEERNRKTPDVEVILSPKDEQFPRIAVEHTIIEAHKEQLAYTHQLCGIEKEIGERCHGNLPINRCFVLIAQPSIIIGMNKKNRAKFVEAMADWVPNAAESLTTDQKSTKSYNGQEVLLWCFGSKSHANGIIRMMPAAPKNALKERPDRFRRAIEEKLPKLIKYKERGFGTALLLEDVSFVHSNPGKHLIPNHCYSAFQSKLDYVVIFISQERKMIAGLVWKEEARLHLEIPDNRRFFEFGSQS